MNKAKFHFEGSRLPAAMRFIRKVKKVTQEDFGVVSSRTYVSSLERGLKVPTLAKIDELAVVLGVHPLTLLALAYASNASTDGVSELLRFVQRETDALLNKAK